MDSTPTSSRTLAFLFWLIGAVACTPLIGPYSLTAYQYATSLKVETLALMDKAQEPYASHRQDVEALFVELQKAHEYAKGIPNNDLTARQWAILINKDGDLIGRFFTRWQERGALSDVFITEFKGPVADAFDEIICLEANKKEASRCVTQEGA